ncbi:MAG TPA: DUF1572 family protein [Flavisolibacter sp.]
MSIHNLYLQSVISRLKEYKSLADRSFEQLGDEDLHTCPNEVSNSIAVIIQHMHGNMVSRWTNFLTEDGEKDWRKRDEEFEDQHFTRQVLMDKWEEGWKVLLDTLESLQPEDLFKTITIRNQPLGVIDAINRQLAHYSSHVGQVIYLARWVRGKDWKTLSIPRK